MNRRQFMASAGGFAVALSAARIRAQSPATLAVKTVRTNILEIGYHESGPPAGIPVILLHGFPDDAHAYDGVLPILAKAGYRALAIYLRGYGPTRFLEPTLPMRSSCSNSRSLASTGAVAPRPWRRRCIRNACERRC
jgi:pimeloyl-ACP methyl ester carboxylesterase